MSSHAASHPRTPPAPPLPALPPAPRGTRWRPRLLRALAYALGLVVLGALAAVTWAISSTIGSRESAATWRSVALGRATVAVPAQWQREAPSAVGVAGLPEPAAAFATAPGLQAHAVVSIASERRSASADVALERLLGPLGTPRGSKVAGRPARTYAPRPVGGDRVAEATLASTAAGTLVVLCIAKSASWTAAAGCAEALGPRSARGARGAT